MVADTSANLMAHNPKVVGSKPGDVIECHGVKQRVTYEFGTYALVKLEG